MFTHCMKNGYWSSANCICWGQTSLIYKGSAKILLRLVVHFRAVYNASILSALEALLGAAIEFRTISPRGETGAVVSTGMPVYCDFGFESFLESQDALKTRLASTVLSVTMIHVLLKQHVKN